MLNISNVVRKVEARRRTVVVKNVVVRPIQKQ